MLSYVALSCPKLPCVALIPYIALRVALSYLGLYCSKAESKVSVVGWWLCKPIFMSNPKPSCFGLLLGWLAVAWLAFGVMTTSWG